MPDKSGKHTSSLKMVFKGYQTSQSLSVGCHLQNTTDPEVDFHNLEIIIYN